MTESLLIEAPSAPLALTLIERLDGFHAELVPLGGERFQVRVELDGRNQGPLRPLLDSLDRIEGWLETSGVDLTEIHLNDRSYKLERGNGAPLLPRTDSELQGLLSKVRTIQIGAGVQVVSVEGELDPAHVFAARGSADIDRFQPGRPRSDRDPVHGLDRPGRHRRRRKAHGRAGPEAAARGREPGGHQGP